MFVNIKSIERKTNDKNYIVKNADGQSEDK